jgi:transcriptional regulator with XRE-family HTH domain
VSAQRPNRAAQKDVQGEVGRRLRLHREQRQLSLRELARRLGLSPSAISQIETGKSRPSVSTLYAIVSELGMSLDELFTPEPASPLTEVARSGRVATTAREERLVQRAASRKAIEFETGVRWERLTSDADPEADFLYVEYDVGGSSAEGNRFQRHSGREYGLVLSGTLEVTVGFDTYTLEPGDSVCFDSTVPHRLRNVGSEPVRGVWLVIGRHGDDRALAFETDGD